MPIQTTCPQCQSQYRLPDTQMGKRVRCKKCQSVFIAGEVVDAPVLKEASGDEVRAKRPSKMDTMVVEELPVFDEVTTAPRSHHAPPARRSYHDDRPRRDDYDDRRDEEPLPAAGSSLPLILGGVGALVLLLGLGIVGAYFFMSSEPDQASTQTEGGTRGTGWPNNQTGRPIINRPANNDPPKPQDFDTALAYVKNNDSTRRRMGLEYLQSARVDPSRRDQLDVALTPLLEDPTHKAEVMKVIRRWGGKHLMAALEEQLASPFDWEEAMKAMAKVPDERAAELIAEHLDKFGHEVAAARALRRMGKRAEKATVKYLHHRNASQHVRPLIKVWRTDDETLATQAAEDLASKDREVKDAAAETLAGCEVVEKLRDKVAEALAEHMKDDWFGTRKKTAKALEKWATADTLDTVHKYLDDGRYDPEVRESMYRAILRIKDEKSIPVLVLRMGSKDKVAAAKVLTAYGSKAEPSVQVLLNSRDVDVRLAGIELLSVIGTKDSVQLLTKLAKIDPKTKKFAQEAVKVIEAREDKGKDKEKDKKGK